MKKYLMVFDVESVGLHGPAFAVGWVVHSLHSFNKIGEGLLALPPDSFRSEDVEGLKWVMANVSIEEYNCSSTLDLQERFWKFWSTIRQDTLLFADCPWPVEANFLETCINNDLPSRRWEGPYPLLDVASFRLGRGEMGFATESRLPDELPVHNPLCDARQSMRQLMSVLQNDTNVSAYYALKEL